MGAQSTPYRLRFIQKNIWPPEASAARERPPAPTSRLHRFWGAVATAPMGRALSFLGGVAAGFILTNHSP